MKNRLIIFGVAALVITIIVLIVANSTLLTIDAGNRGVLFRPFSGGIDKETIYQPGFHMIAPWNTMYVYDVKEKQLEESMTVLSSNGLNIKLDVTVRVNPSVDKIGELHNQFGINYMTSLVSPEVRSAVRSVIGRYQPEELYSSKREEVQSMIHRDLEKTLAENFIELQATLIRDIELPEKVRRAIEDKIEAEQKALKYEYILAQESKEKERILIEASAKAEANKILTESLNDRILSDKGIEATLKLTNAPNSKIVIIGSGKNGLPLILGGN